jgi:uroporphyrinogen-III decarboxylase
VEKEYMKADEYDDLIRDPSDFLIRKYMPRIFGKLQGFQKLGNLGSLLQMPFTSTYLTAFGRPEVRTAFEALMSAGEEAIKWRKAVSACNRQVTQAGYPLVAGGSTLAPYDAIADTLRGSRGVMTDIYRQPDKLLEAMEKLTPVMVELGAEAARATGRPLIFIPLHKGADAFMSDKQYKTFYWPTLKKMIMGYVEQGMVPFLFAEGGYTSRLDIIGDIPKGKVIWHFDFTDMALAKQALGDTACIAGNVPISLLNTGTPDEVKEYCKELIDVAGKDGGFIMTSGGVIDKAKPENVRAMIEYTREYGVYR